MYYQNLYTKSGELFAKSFIRVVHGGRGDYIEFNREQIIPQLFYKYVEDVNGQHKVFIESEKYDLYNGYYYHWLYPNNDLTIKVYYQLRYVQYADYKLYHFYVSPDLFINFKQPDSLF